MANGSPAAVKVRSIDQVALVVRDIEKTVESYWNILGIGPWSIFAWEAPTVFDRTYHGKPSEAREKIAIARVGTVQLELCQPVEGDSIYQDFLVEHGEGLHHINFLVDDVDQTAEALAREGFPSLQSGRTGSREQPGAYNYIDIPPLHAIWEPVQQGKGLPVQPIRYPAEPS